MEFLGFIFLVFIAYCVFNAFKNAREKDAVNTVVTILEGYISLAAKKIINDYGIPKNWISYITSRYDVVIISRANEIYKNKKYIKDPVHCTAESIMLTLIIEIKEASESLEKRGALMDYGFDMTEENIKFVVDVYEHMK